MTSSGGSATGKQLSAMALPWRPPTTVASSGFSPSEGLAAGAASSKPPSLPWRAPAMSGAPASTAARVATTHQSTPQLGTTASGHKLLAIHSSSAVVSQEMPPPPPPPPKSGSRQSLADHLTGTSPPHPAAAASSGFSNGGGGSPSPMATPPLGAVAFAPGGGPFASSSRGGGASGSMRLPSTSGSPTAPGGPTSRRAHPNPSRVSPTCGGRGREASGSPHMLPSSPNGPGQPARRARGVSSTAAGAGGGSSGSVRPTPSGEGGAGHSVGESSAGDGDSVVFLNDAPFFPSDTPVGLPSSSGGQEVVWAGGGGGYYAAPAGTAGFDGADAPSGLEAAHALPPVISATTFQRPAYADDFEVASQYSVALSVNGDLARCYLHNVRAQSGVHVDPTTGMQSSGDGGGGHPSYDDLDEWESQMDEDDLMHQSGAFDPYARDDDDDDDLDDDGHPNQHDGDPDDVGSSLDSDERRWLVACLGQQRQRRQEEAEQQQHHGGKQVPKLPDNRSTTATNSASSPFAATADTAEDLARLFPF